MRRSIKMILQRPLRRVAKLRPDFMHGQAEDLPFKEGILLEVVVKSRVGG